MAKNHYRRTSCLICESKRLYKFLDLGKTPLADSFITKKEMNKAELYFPLSINVCKDCNHMQIVDAVNPRLLFPEQYALFSSFSPAVVKHWENYAQDIHDRFGEIKNKFVVEIASNDGVLLVPMKKLGFKVLGVEPAVNTAEVARSRGVDVVTEFFSESYSRKHLKKFGKAGMVLANNVIAHTDDPVGFVRGVKNILDPEGIFVFEFQYGLELIKHTEFDNVYHEHLSFFTVRPLEILLKKCGMRLFDVRTNKMQGGSLRCFATHAENNYYKESSIISRMKKEEISNGLNKIKTYDDFGKRALAIKTNLIKIIGDIKKSGKKIVGYGAPAKGNTLLNFCGIGPESIDYCIERTEFKFNKFTPGTHIPVVSDEVIKKDGHPDYYLLLIWNHLDNISVREKNYLEKGGKFIVPIPEPRLI
jgi:SAM-dependent methyltransferase